MSQPEVTSEDPAVRDSRREAMIVLIFSACALAYSVTTSYILGYSAGGRELRFVNLGSSFHGSFVLFLAHYSPSSG